ncbi:hypothetical protein LZ30DRAFT_332408 [Colletotrichum cereale]|nr:hypothetical protein LZ30DRAFT_332408 [Colletotrichum cereale]
MLLLLPTYVRLLLCTATAFRFSLLPASGAEVYRCRYCDSVVCVWVCMVVPPKYCSTLLPLPLSVHAQLTPFVASYL